MSYDYLVKHYSPDEQDGNYFIIDEFEQIIVEDTFRVGPKIGKQLD